MSPTDLLLLKKKVSVESGYVRQQRLQKLMQIKLQQTQRHLGDDRRQPDEKATTLTPWLLLDIDCCKPQYVAVFSIQDYKRQQKLFLIDQLFKNTRKFL